MSKSLYDRLKPETKEKLELQKSKCPAQIESLFSKLKTINGIGDIPYSEVLTLSNLCEAYYVYQIILLFEKME